MFRACLSLQATLRPLSLWGVGMQMTGWQVNPTAGIRREGRLKRERVTNGVPVCLHLSKSSIPKSKNSPFYWNSFPYEFIPIEKESLDSFLQKANSISALKI